MTTTGKLLDKFEADRRAVAAARRDGIRWYVLFREGEYNLCHADSVEDAWTEGWIALYHVNPND